jgi:NAD(P)-dependent dehydrogenase (short-subunit alcohol dehydrogenase family)
MSGGWAAEATLRPGCATMGGVGENAPKRATARRHKPHIWGPMGQLDDKVVLLSGGASGIGRATALFAAQEGASVAIGDVALDVAQAIAKEITATGGRALAAHCDVRSEESVAAFVDLAATTFGGIDCLDHNAAWSHPRLDTDAGDIDLGIWSRVMETNTRGALFLARHAIPHMIERGGGSIVNISSGTSTIGESTRVAYGVSKAAINQLTRHLATRYGRDGIRANAIAPGFILTETAETQVPQDIKARLAASNPTRRLGRPEDIAQVVVFLFSEAASYVNGQLLHVDGGHQIAGIM